MRALPPEVLRAITGPKMSASSVLDAATRASLDPVRGVPSFAPPHLPARPVDPAATLASAVIASRGIRVTEQEAVAIYREVRRLMENPSE